MRLFVVPELDRRQLAGTLSPPVAIEAFQILWNQGSGAPPLVRINDDIRTLLQVDVPARDGLIVGESITLDATDQITGVHPIPEEEKFANFTAVFVAGKWAYSFDFRYQKESARNHVLAAEEFFEAARLAHAAGATRAFLENAHSVLELVLKVELLLLSQIGAGRIQHTEVRQKAAPFLHLKDFHALLGRLAELRLPARYLVGDLVVEPAELEEIRRELEQALQQARERTVSFGPPA